MKCGTILLIISTLIGIYIGILTRRVSNLFDPSKCPFCYGSDLCKDIARIRLQYKTFSDLFYNLFSVKNIFFAEYDGKRVVLKKLGHDSELEQIKSHSVDEESLVDYLVNSASGLRICYRDVAKRLVKRLRKHFDLEQIWTISQVNCEPLMLAILNGPIPKLYGSCGFVIVEEYCGQPLNHFETSPWHVRAFLALQLLEAAIDFTHKHHDFRVYLTDISPDNIAVDHNFKLTFVDLEHVILQRKENQTDVVHNTQFFPDDDFIFSEAEICSNSLSDHNIYAVCRLLLSRKAPWPMMANGLLHSPPPTIARYNNELFLLLEDCVDSNQRFDIAEKLINLLKKLNKDIS
ncbi:Deleted in autism protein 1 homolog-like Protein [Tribolium castaneum]|uniref:Deleted in autism protein 1 homolog-like Protein n=1 Tax=Tribolium castaneum TaxID=7070 RepID=D6WV89_TRICA|nr:PREDICTED: deleted in autism protein 1 homolog isoform X5 [Tribolium castaneum]XP_015838452.1 PREDICTED: deleted in autism protein 1 homolog isoform X5 [Tribolium castaneum]EFA09089.2 Deleted in autism protein 1 homolog-like Protein [Tribolium castaneum]|eukprot:XP_008197496.1 PREDICTED: deleted in autism protein 1 homolog isoform X5 [Tribolium castaneum]